MYYCINEPDYSNMTEQQKKEQEGPNTFNAKVLDTILDDDSDQFIQLISQHQDVNYEFNLTNYKLPKILLYKPPIAGVCLVFNSEKCFYALVNQLGDGLLSEQLKKKDGMGRTLMHFCAFGGNLEIFRELNQNNFDINEGDNTRKTPSHYSAISGTTDIMKYITLKGVNIFYNVEFGSMTPLHMACLYGNFEVVKFICENARRIDLVECDSYHSNFYRNLTPLHLACEGGNDEIVKYLLNDEVMWKSQIKALDREGRSPLLVAVEYGNLSCVKLLIQSGKAKQHHKGRKHVALIDAVIGGYKDIILYLLKNGADIKMTNYKKLTALDVAVKYDDFDIVKILIDHGAMNDFDDQNLADLFVEVLGTLDFEMINFFNGKFNIPYLTKGDMFMGKAVQLESKELVNYLLDKKCTLNNIGQYVTFTSRWRPFLDFLREKGVNVSEIESDNGVPLIVKSIKGGNLKSVKKMIAEGSKLTKKIIDDNDCILSTCIKGNRKLFNFLLTFNPNMSKSTSFLYNLLNHYEEYRDRSKETKIKDRLKMADTLIAQYRADPNQTEIIREAAERGNLRILELFAKYNVDFNKCSIDNSELNDDVLQFLRNHGYVSYTQSRNVIQRGFPLLNPNRNLSQLQNVPQYQMNNQMSIMKFINYKK